jgi:hypothetical protein
MNNFLKIGLILGISLIFSCQENDTPFSNTNSRGILSSLLPSNPIFDDLIAQYDTTDITGLIDIRYENVNYFELNYSSTFLPDSTISPINYEGLDIEATFFDNHLGNTLEIDSLLFEGEMFQERFLNGRYMYYLEDESVFSWADTNHLSLDSNSNFVGFDENVYFSDKPIISNISTGDTLSKSSNLTINWSGSSGDYAQITVSKAELPSTSSVNGHGNFTEDDGSYIIPSTEVSQYDSGKFIISVLTYEPEFITMSDGKKVCVLVQAECRISVYLN